MPHWMDNSDVTWEFILDNSEKRHSWRKLSPRKNLAMTDDPPHEMVN